MSAHNLAWHLRQSESHPFLLLGPPAPKRWWVYRDFFAMPREMWLDLLGLLGEGDIELVAANDLTLPPAPLCRAQMWISPAAQKRWSDYLAAAGKDEEG